MKKVIFLLICFLFAYEIQNQVGKNEKEIIEEKANFIKTLKKLRSYEGNYSHSLNDKGGETYAGITRLYNPNWYGWKAIDKLKIKIGPLKWNTKVEEAEVWVIDYYLNVWVDDGFDKIKSQETANYLFDIRINSGKNVTINLCNYVLSEYKCKLLNKRKSNWVDEVLNNVPIDFVSKLSNKRIRFYETISKKDSTQRTFLKHWIKRAKDIS